LLGSHWKEQPSECNFEMLQQFQIFESISNSMLFYLKKYLCRKNWQKLCVIHSQWFEIIACTGGAKIHTTFAPVCTRMWKTVRSRYLMQKTPFLMILFSFSSVEESSSCSKKLWSNLLGNTISPRRCKVVYRVFLQIHHSAPAWAIGIPSLFSWYKVDHNVARIAIFLGCQKLLVFSF